jgi:hypothetical protein
VTDEIITMRRSYVFKVWLSTIIVSPPLFWLIAFLRQSHDITFEVMWSNALALMVYGLILSLPTLLIWIVLFPLLYKRVRKPLVLKTGMVTVGVLCIAITFLILFGLLDPLGLQGFYDVLVPMSFYVLSIIAFGFIYKTRAK